MAISLTKCYFGQQLRGESTLEIKENSAGAALRYYLVSFGVLSVGAIENANQVFQPEDRF
jgi:hypothetical protein